MNLHKAVSKTITAVTFFSLVCAMRAPASAADFSPFSGSGRNSMAEQIAAQGDKVSPVAAPVPPAPAFQPSPAFQDRGKLEHIWPDIVFLRGADYAEFEYTMSQNRDMVRQMLWQEFSSVMIPMAAANADLNELAKTLAGILLTFDGMHSKHKDDAVQGINISFENQFRAEIDGLYRAYAIGDESRRMDFIYYGAPVVVDVKAKSPRQTLPMEILKGVDYVLYGSYTMLGGANISVTLTIEKIGTGQIRSFEVTAPIKDAMRLLAKKVFDFFQSNEYAGWVNPQPKLQWIPSPVTQPQATATVAKLYCRGQGARFPYARELIMASQGTAYLPGGIPPLKDYAIYMVSDKQRWDEQHYFFTGTPGEATGGPVRTSAGYGVINGSYWCVKGPVSRDISFYEDVYALIRKPETPQPVRTALECILAKLDDFGARQENAGAFPTIEKAVMFLAREGYTVKLPE